MKLKVENYYDFHPADTYLCRDEEGRTHYVDLLVDGTFSEILSIEDRKTLIGKTVEVDYLSPFVEIASNPRIVTEGKE